MRTRDILVSVMISYLHVFRKIPPSHSKDVEGVTCGEIFFSCGNWAEMHRNEQNYIIHCTNKVFILSRKGIVKFAMSIVKRMTKMSMEFQMVPGYISFVKGSKLFSCLYRLGDGGQKILVILVWRVEHLFRRNSCQAKLRFDVDREIVQHVSYRLEGSVNLLSVKSHRSLFNSMYELECAVKMFSVLLI